ncbi:MerR family transcriptional regulator [Brevibacterium sp. K11IcPPYGO002]|uniref:MerR family transcriptional regulator n=1 Tax=Brevibacterium sp. K11IcPPYGO002 TaxID=3058837 RepID=UPI003D81A4E6
MADSGEEVAMLIGEVARRSGVSARMLRHYESLGLVLPSQRTPGGYREYSDADIGRIFHIEGLRKLGMSLTEVSRVLSEPDFDPGTVLGDLIDQARERIAAEQRLLDHLQSVARLGRADGESLLYTIDLMRSLESGDVIQRHKAALGSGVDGGMPIEALSQAVLQETVLNAAGAMRWALAQAGAEAVPHVVVGMDDASAQVRRNALIALDEIRRTTPDEKLDSRSTSMIRQALDKGLDDVDSDIRSIAALTLGRSGDEKAVPVLLDMAMNGPRDIEAAETLGFIVDATGPRADMSERIMTELHRHADSSDTTARFRVLQVLLEIPGEHSDDFITELSNDDSPELAATARAALRRRREQPPRTGRT